MLQPTVASKNLLSSNPARFGLAAKIWECLRRNQAFQLALEQWRQSKLDNIALAPSVHSQINGHPYASLVLEKLGTNDVPSNVETLPWNKVRNLIKVFHERAEYRPQLVEIPEPPDYPEELTSWATKHRPLWRDAYVVAAPTFVRDDRHQKSLVYQITARVGGRDAPKAANLEPKGKTLGTPEQWEIFIFVEQFKRFHTDDAKDKDRPIKQAAWWYAHRAHYDNFKGDRLGKEGKKFASSAFRPRGHWLRGCISVIEQHRKGIYPDFRGFE